MAQTTPAPSGHLLVHVLCIGLKMRQDAHSNELSFYLCSGEIYRVQAAGGEVLTLTNNLTRMPFKRHGICFSCSRTITRVMEASVISHVVYDITTSQGACCYSPRLTCFEPTVCRWVEKKCQATVRLVAFQISGWITHRTIVNKL